LIVLGYTLIPIVHMLNADALTFSAFMSKLPTIAEHWFIWTLVVVFGRVAYLIWKHNFFLSMVWYVKLVTDPLTDIVAYFPRWPQRA
jgi:glutamate-1-semialdehyde 2,1-aminomutase